MTHRFLVHDAADSVGVAVDDLPAGTRVTGKSLRGSATFEVTTRDAVPLGHKLALRAVSNGEKVVEYGEVIAQATADIPAGAHVHVHNVTSVRWPRSSAGARVA